MFRLIYFLSRKRDLGLSKKHKKPHFTTLHSVFSALLSPLKGADRVCRYNFGEITVRGVEGFCLDMYADETQVGKIKPHSKWLVSRTSHLLSYFKQGFYNQELSDEDKRYLAKAERLMIAKKSST